MAAPEQTIWIVRYGLTKYPLQENKGPYDSPIDPVVGVEHAEAIAKAIAKAPDKPRYVYSSPFLRTAETAHLIARRSYADTRIEYGLTEWQVPSLLVDEAGIRTNPRDTYDLKQYFDTIDVMYNSVNPHGGGEGSPVFPESEEKLLERCAKTIQAILNATKENICIVSHAPCDQAIAYYLEGAKSIEESKLGPWALGGITKFKGGKLIKYSDTSHMPGIYEPGIGKWSLPCLDK